MHKRNIFLYFLTCSFALIFMCIDDENKRTKEHIGNELTVYTTVHLIRTTK